MNRIRMIFSLTLLVAAASLASASSFAPRNAADAAACGPGCCEVVCLPCGPDACDASTTVAAIR